MNEKAIYANPVKGIERMWVKNHYFKTFNIGSTLHPKYNDLVSGINRINTLKGQVLLRVYEEKLLT